MDFHISQSTLLVFLAIVLGLYFIYTHSLGAGRGPREPPIVPGSIPYIGHIIGLMRNNFNYYVQLRYFISVETPKLIPRHPCRQDAMHVHLRFI